MARKPKKGREADSTPGDSTPGDSTHDGSTPDATAADVPPTMLQKGASLMGSISARVGCFFPVVLFVVCVAAIWIVTGALDLESAPVGEPLTARMTWAVSAMLFIMFFAFALVACHVVMFRCGLPQHALLGSIGTTIAGLSATLIWMYPSRNLYWGPTLMKQYLDATAFCVGYVEPLTAAFDGMATWSALLVVTTSAVILGNETDDEGELSRQLRGSKILMYAAAALLISGVSEVAALHKWPQYEVAPVMGCANPAATELYKVPTSIKSTIEPTAMAISSSIGTIASLVLASAYLPLTILLRQRAYRIVKPWQRAETWLAIHGFALQPTQQLAKILLILSPLLAGGPINYLISLLNQ